MTTNFRATDGRVVDLSEIVSSASAALGLTQYEMGTVISGTNASQWVYAKLASTTPAYTVQYLIRVNSASFVCAQAKTALPPGTPCFVSNASVDSGAFAWLQARGNCLIIAAGTISAMGPMFAAASGVLTDATSTADYIAGLRVYSTGSGTLNAWISWPFISAYGNT